MPREDATLVCSHHDRPATLDPRSGGSCNALAGEQFPYVVRLYDGGAARLLPRLH